MEKHERRIVLRSRKLCRNSRKAMTALALWRVSRSRGAEELQARLLSLPASYPQTPGGHRKR